MIDTNFIICTECLKNSRRKPKRFKSFKNLSIHLARKHNTKYRVKVEKGTIKTTRTKKPKLKIDLV